MTACGAFGSGGLGATPFGSATTFGVELEVVQETQNSVLVTVSGASVTPSSLGADPLDVSSWALELADPNVLSGATLPLVQAVEPYDGDTVRVLFDAPCTPGQGYAIVYLPGVDVECGFSASASFVAFGLPLSDGLQVGGVTQGRFDIANPQFVTDAAGNVISLGTWQVDSTGDLAIETGTPYLRKRIVRRLTTSLGSFLFALGYGLKVPQKQNLRPSELRRLKVLAEEQIAREPDVASVGVSLSNPSPGLLIFYVRVAATDGTIDEFETNLGGA